MNSVRISSTPVRVMLRIVEHDYLSVRVVLAGQFESIVNAICGAVTIPQFCLSNNYRVPRIARRPGELY